MGVVVPLDEVRDPNAGLKPLLDLVEEDMGSVNQIILEKAQSDVNMIPDLARHLIDSGGKRLRPMLTIASAKMSNYDGAGHIKLAASVEFMHTATLLHDDVVDDSDLRRVQNARSSSSPRLYERTTGNVIFPSRKSSPTALPSWRCSPE